MEAASRQLLKEQIRESLRILNDREREVLELIARGLANPRIAQQLGISTKTVGNHVSIIFGKLQVADRAEAISAFEAGRCDANLCTGCDGIRRRPHWLWQA